MTTESPSKHLLVWNEPSPGLFLLQCLCGIARKPYYRGDQLWDYKESKLLKRAYIWQGHPCASLLSPPYISDDSLVSLKALFKQRADKNNGKSHQLIWRLAPNTTDDFRLRCICGEESTVRFRSHDLWLKSTNELTRLALVSNIHPCIIHLGGIGAKISNTDWLVAYLRALEARPSPAVVRVTNAAYTGGTSILTNFTTPFSPPTTFTFTPTNTQSEGHTKMTLNPKRFVAFRVTAYNSETGTAYVDNELKLVQLDEKGDPPFTTADASDKLVNDIKTGVIRDHPEASLNSLVVRIDLKAHTDN